MALKRRFITLHLHLNLKCQQKYLDDTMSNTHFLHHTHFHHPMLTLSPNSHTHTHTHTRTFSCSSFTHLHIISLFFPRHSYLLFCTRSPEPYLISILKVLGRGLRLEPDFAFCSVAQLTPGFVGADLVALIREASLCAVNR